MPQIDHQSNNQMEINQEQNQYKINYMTNPTPHHQKNQITDYSNNTQSPQGYYTTIPAKNEPIKAQQYDRQVNYQQQSKIQ